MLVPQLVGYPVQEERGIAIVSLPRSFCFAVSGNV